MSFVSHPIIRPDKMEEREYQTNILKTAIEKNTLVVLPTGTGKTNISVLLAANRLQKYPDSKILIISPTRPLCAQHQKSFEDYFKLVGDISLITGVISPEKRKKMYDTSVIIIATPQCVTADTQIFLSGHGPIVIKELCKNSKFRKTDYMGESAWIADIRSEVLGYRNSKIGLVRATKFWKIRAKKTVKIKTELKNCIETTPEHPLLTITGDGVLKWVSAEMLREGQHIAMAKEVCLPSKKFYSFDLIKNSKDLRIADRKLINKLLEKHKKIGLKRGNISKYYVNTMPCKDFFELSELCKFSLPKKLLLTNKTAKSKSITVCNELTDDLYYVVGAMLGDGHIGVSEGKGKEVVLSALDKKNVMNKFENMVFRNFGIRPKHDKMKGLIYYSTAFANLLISLGVPYGDKAEKIRVPYYVFESEKSAICNFISGIFDTDGSAAKHDIKIVSTVSLNMAKDAKWLLLKLGIPSSIYTRTNNKAIFRDKIYDAKDLYELSVSGEIYLQQLLDSCDFDNFKVKVLKNGIKDIINHLSRSKEILPIKQLLKNIGQEHNNMGGRPIDRYRFSSLSLNNIKDLALNAESDSCNYLSELANLPFRWVKIKSIKINKKPKWVYDLTIEDEHNFIGNWLINHNTIQNDVKHGLLNLREFSMLTVDEAHKAVGNYAYTYVVERYSKQSQFPRILALTASPGSTRDKIDLIRKNLFVDAVEIRTELDADVKPYIKEKEIEYARVELTEELKNIQNILKGSIKTHLDKLREYDIYASSKRELLDAQKRTSKRIAMEKQPYLYHLVASIAQTVKIWHLLELLETQSIQSTKNYIDKIKLKETASDKRIMNDVDVLKAMKLIEAYKTEHPKIEKIKQIIIEELENNEKAKIIVFSHFRDNIDTLNETLKDICRPVILIGQSGEHGLSQKEQINVIRDYECDIFNCLITSPIGEEGLDIHGGADIGIFYDSVPSEIRTIQRRGRVGRTKVGKVIMMLTKNTRDEIYHYSAQRKEKNMKTILKSMQGKNTLNDFV